MDFVQFVTTARNVAVDTVGPEKGLQCYGRTPQPVFLTLGEGIIVISNARHLQQGDKCVGVDFRPEGRDWASVLLPLDYDPHTLGKQMASTLLTGKIPDLPSEYVRFAAHDYNAGLRRPKQ